MDLVASGGEVQQRKKSRSALACFLHDRIAM